MRPDTRRNAWLLAAVCPIAGLAAALVGETLYPGQPWVVSNWVRLGTTWLLFTLLTPLVVWLAERVPFRLRPRPVLIHVSGALLFGMALATLPSIAANLSAGVRAMGGIDGRTHNAVTEALAYIVIVGVVAVLRHRRLARRSILARARLEARLERARLDELRVGVEPDRVMAAVSAIEADVETHPARAEEELHRLSRFLRAKLARIGAGLPGGRAIEPPPPPPAAFLVYVAVFFAYAGFGAFASLARMLNNIIHGNGLAMPAAIGEIVAMSVAGALSPLLVAAFRRRTRRSHTANLRIGVLTLGHALATEYLVMHLREIGIYRPPGQPFMAALAMSCVVLFLLRRGELEQFRAASRLANAELSQLVSEATLRSLRTQLAPHFLFNTLNSVLHLVRRDAAAARTMLQRLQTLLRTTVLQDRRQEVSLREDLEVTENYVEIERVRFRDALDVSLRIDPATLDAQVPSFLLQPLVENAIRHGALQTLGRCSITVCARREGDALQIAIDNDGCLVSPESWREGIGLSSVRLRLRHLYGAEQDVSAEILAPQGVCVKIRLPYRTAIP